METGLSLFLRPLVMLVESRVTLLLGLDWRREVDWRSEGE